MGPNDLIPVKPYLENDNAGDTIPTHGVAQDTKASELAAAFRMPAQADSVAADVPALVVDFNLLLAKLRAAGLMAE